MSTPLITLTFAACLALGSQGHADHKSWLMDIVSRIVCDTKRTGNPEKVAFSSSLGKMLTTKENQVIVFDVVNLNQGNCYNSSTGIFTSRVPGLYQFNWILYQTSGTAGLHMHLLHNNVAKINGYLATSRGTLSGTTLLSLRTGDKVWIRLNKAGHNMYHKEYNSYSGMLLYRNSE